jgi:hypothetical protein
MMSKLEDQRWLFIAAAIVLLSLCLALALVLAP